MRCPKCGKNIHSHHQEINDTKTKITRYYGCQKCHHKFRTVEKIVEESEEVLSMAEFVNESNKTNLIDILNLMDRKQELHIFLEDNEYVMVSVFTALKIINDETLYRKVSRIEICGSVLIHLEGSEN